MLENFLNIEGLFTRETGRLPGRFCPAFIWKKGLPECFFLQLKYAKIIPFVPEWCLHKEKTSRLKQVLAYPGRDKVVPEQVFHSV